MAEIFTVRCKGCGASVVYEPGTESLKCPYCGAQEEIPAQYEGIQEIDLEEALRAAQPAREALPEHKVLFCASCGAQIAYREARAKCDFCGAEAVSEKALTEQPVRPQGVLPFALSPEEAQQVFQTWLKNLWFAPNDLRQRSRIQELRGVYLPLWTFDAQVEAHWSAIPGYYRTRTVQYYDSAAREWRTRTETYVEWGLPVSGVHRDFYDDVLISGFQSLPTRYIDEIGGFATTTDLRAYEPRYFLGWDVALPDKPLPDAWQEGHKRIQDLTAEACKRAIPGDTYRDFQMRMRLWDLTTKLAYVPIYILAYRYGGKPYRVVIHGRTGVVAGDRPISWIKVTLFVVALGAIVGLIAYWASGGKSW
ncbi:MAG: hypothetical protein N3A68_02205 [Bacteroidia bacterium]|jgi:predicted RNA-binding Zn-ribbon protein involved in translation (DUF1610 family)|nr:hypothetical protein [Bacteroidia bacterium]GIV23253.1 MAG: hypothetical protein KatS3mg025_0912 [Bacteroidia bacterium]